MQTTTPPKYKIPLYRVAPPTKKYRKAWKRFWQIGAKIRAQWKTKKSPIQIIEEGRRP